MDLIIDHALRASAPAELSESVFYCAKEIMSQIYSGSIEPSTRLGETSLSKQLGQSKALVRSALDHLAHVGVLERRARSGTYVRTLSLGEFVERVGLRACLEGLSAREACLHLTEAQLSRLKDMAVKIDESIRVQTVAPTSLLELDSKFHMIISKASQNSLLVSELTSQKFLLRCLGDAKLLNLPMVGTRSQKVAGHLEIVQALKQRDPQLAEATIRDHIFGSLYSCLESYHKSQVAESALSRSEIKNIECQLGRVSAWINRT